MTSPQIITTTNKRVMEVSDHYRQNINEKIPPNKGEAFGGGYYIADITYGDGRKFGIILSPKSGGENGGSTIMYKTSTSADPATFNNEDDGFAISELMKSTTYPAGNFCRSLSIGGYTDWYLPARNELTAIWNNRTNIPSGEEMITNQYYWTSTQYSSYTNYAWIRNFNNDNENYFNKTNYYYVRAIRRFPLN